VSGPIGHESVPKIIINDTVDLVFKTAISYLVGLISNHNSVRVLFDETASVYFISKIYLYSALEMASPGNQRCANCIGTLSFPIKQRYEHNCLYY